MPPPRAQQASAALRVRSAGGGMCVAPHVPVLVPSAASLATATARPRRKKLKWRTRDSQSSRLYNLQLDVQDVRQQIRALDEYRALLAARTLLRPDDPDGRYVRSVVEYHRVFERGYVRSPPTADGRPPRVDARQFLVCMMDADVRIGRFTGLDVLLDQWERYTRAQTGLDFRYTGSRVVRGDGFATVVSRATYSHVVTLDMVEAMFPRLPSDHPGILAKLLGATVRGEGEYEFTFDARSHRVVRFEFRLDYVEVLARLLRDMRELDAVFSRARISQESLIGDVDVYDAYRRDGDHGQRELEDEASVEELPPTHHHHPQQQQQQRRDVYSVASLLAPVAHEQADHTGNDVPVDPPDEHR